MCADGQCYDQSSVHWYGDQCSFNTPLSVSVRRSKALIFIQSRHFVPITEVTKGASYVTGCGSAGFKNITHIRPSYENTEGEAD